MNELIDCITVSTFVMPSNNNNNSSNSSNNKEKEGIGKELVQVSDKLVKFKQEDVPEFSSM